MREERGERYFVFISLMISNPAAIPANPQQHFPREQQHHCLPCTNRYHLGDDEGRLQTKGKLKHINITNNEECLVKSANNYK